MSPVVTVFVSFASEDRAIVTAFDQALASCGIKAKLYDESLPAGSSVVGWIDTALADADYSVIVASDAYFSKQWTLLEYRAILHAHVGGGDRPFFVATTSPGVPLPPLLNTFRRVSLSDPGKAAKEIAAVAGGSYPAEATADGAFPPSVRPAESIASKIDALSERDMITIANAVCKHWYDLRRSPGPSASLHASVGQRDLEIAVAVSVLDDELLRIQMVGEAELARIHFRFLTSLKGAIERGGLGVFVPAYEIEFDRRREEFAKAVLSLRESLVAIATRFEFT